MVMYPESLDDTPPPRKRGWLRFVWRHLPGIAFSLMVTLLLVVVLWPYVVITVPSGRVGVLWKRFNGFDIYCWCFVGRGTVLDPRELREEGLHVIAPWDRLFLYDLRLQSTTETINAISKDGVSVTAQVNVRYQLLHHSVAVLHKFIGPQYLETVIGPEIGSQAREVFSTYTAQQIYTSRDTIQQEILASTQKSLGANLDKLVQPEAMEQPDPKHYNDFLRGSIQILDTLVLSIELPPAIVSAINRQTEQFYLIQEYKFRVEREAEESKRKQVEANGIAAFQRTVSQGISDSYLRWRGIEATLALAQSRNAKIVVIGTGKDGLPIILGNVDSPAVPETPPPGGQPGTNGAAPSALPSPPASEQTPPGAPSTTPGAQPRGGGSTEAETPPGSSSSNAPSGSDKMPIADSPIVPAAAPAVPASPGKPTKSAGLLDLSDIESFLAKVSGALRIGGSTPASGPGAQSKQ
jgi:regulator of protease activity HflC (stomatin/prohibitin superfamily)